MVSSAGVCVWRAGMVWGVGVSEVKGLKSCFWKHGTCSKRWRLYIDSYMDAKLLEHR